MVVVWLFHTRFFFSFLIIMNYCKEANGNPIKMWTKGGRRHKKFATNLVWKISSLLKIISDLVVWILISKHVYTMPKMTWRLNPCPSHRKIQWKKNGKNKKKKIKFTCPVLLIQIIPDVASCGAVIKIASSLILFTQMQAAVSKSYKCT